MEKKEVQTAGKVMEAICVLADYLGMTEQEVANNICFLNKERYAKIVAANKTHNSFYDLSFDDRAKVYGYEVETLENGNKAISTTL